MSLLLVNLYSAVFQFLCLCPSSVAGGFVLFVRACERPCVRPETLFTRYLSEYVTHFLQICIYDALWDTDVCFTIWGQKVKGQGDCGMKKHHFLSLLTQCLENY